MSAVPRYRRRDGVLSRTFAGEVLLATPDREGVDRLELTAAAVWDALEAPATVPDISATLAATYDAPNELIVRDVDALLGDLADRGWILEDADA